MTLITFIIPVRHPDNARDWPLQMEKLGQTLASIRNQTHDDWRAIVVANAGAALPAMPAGVSVLEVDFPPNPMPDLAGVSGDSPERTARLAACRADKGRRILAGMQAAPDSRYFMPCDDDDFISRHLVAHVAANDGANGWAVTRGWLWDEGGDFLFRFDAFDRYCGTSLIVRRDLWGLPAPGTQADPEWISLCLGSHVFLRPKLAAAGTPLAPLPFRGAVYRVGSAHSHSQIGRIRDQEGIDHPPLHRVARYLRHCARFRYITGRCRRDYFGAPG